MNPVTGEVSKIYLFVGVLPFSQKAYFEPTLDMRERTWLRCHVHMYEFWAACHSVQLTVDTNTRARMRAVLKRAAGGTEGQYSHFWMILPKRVAGGTEKVYYSRINDAQPIG